MPESKKSVRAKEFTAHLLNMHVVDVDVMFTMTSTERRELGRFLIETADQMEEGRVNFPIMLMVERGEVTLSVPEGRKTEEEAE
jgi:hypothetical protein